VLPGGLPDAWPGKPKRYQALSLASNQLAGSIPDSWASLVYGSARGGPDRQQPEWELGPALAYDLSPTGSITEEFKTGWVAPRTVGL